MDGIAARTQAVKRTVYDCFGPKAGLSLAVLEAASGEIRHAEQDLCLDHLPPLDAIRRLVAIEHIHHGKNWERSRTIREVNAAVIGTLTRVLD